jgi:hypothetical protein
MHENTFFMWQNVKINTSILQILNYVSNYSSRYHSLNGLSGKCDYV